MSKKPVLVIMAAGMGSRYGGLKQIDPVDPYGNMIIDFSIYDAKQAGFEKVIFIIKKAINISVLNSLFSKNLFSVFPDTAHFINRIGRFQDQVCKAYLVCRSLQGIQFFNQRACLCILYCLRESFCFPGCFVNSSCRICHYSI